MYIIYIYIHIHNDIIIVPATMFVAAKVTSLSNAGKQFTMFQDNPHAAKHMGGEFGIPINHLPMLLGCTFW